MFIDKMRSLLCMTWTFLKRNETRIANLIDNQERWRKTSSMSAFGCFYAGKFNRKKKFHPENSFYIQSTSGAQMTMDRAVATGRETDGAPPATGNSARRIIWTLRVIGESEPSVLAALQISLAYGVLYIHFALNVISCPGVYIISIKFRGNGT